MIFAKEKTLRFKEKKRTGKRRENRKIYFTHKILFYDQRN